MLPFCHSNGFSDIYQGGDGECVCKMDVSGVAFDNHPGGTGTNTLGRKKGWRPWKRRDGINVEAQKAMIATEEHPFWLYKPGQNGAASITIGRIAKGDEDPDNPGYDKSDPPRELDVRYYFSHINGMEFYQRWDNQQHKVVYGGIGTYVFFIEAECDRLMLAQNVRLVSNGQWSLDTSHASIKWFAPRLVSAFDQNQNTDARPYRSPLVSVLGWPLEEPPFASGNYGDWRYNPKKAVTHQTQNITGDRIPPIDKPNDDPVKLDKGQSMFLLDHAISNGQSLSDTFSGWGRYMNAGHVHPADLFDDPDALIMLYGLKCVNTDVPDLDEHGNEQYDSDGNLITKWGYADWWPIYWKEGSASPVPDVFGMEDNTQALVKRLLGTNPYSATPNASNKDLLQEGDNHDFSQDIDLFSAFDLRLYCVRYNVKVCEIIANPRYGEHNQPELIVGPRLVPATYFNTKCWASVRQISPSPPR